MQCKLLILIMSILVISFICHHLTLLLRVIRLMNISDKSQICGPLFGLNLSSKNIMLTDIKGVTESMGF